MPDAQSAPRNAERGARRATLRGWARRLHRTSYDTPARPCSCSSAFLFTMLPVCWVRPRTSFVVLMDTMPRIICATQSPRSLTVFDHEPPMEYVNRWGNFERTRPENDAFYWTFWESTPLVRDRSRVQSSPAAPEKISNNNT